MTATGNDCYFYYAGGCYKGDKCNFRHQPAALGSETTCDLWKQGICTRLPCEFRHSILQKGNNIVKCCWENQPHGCLKPNCNFYHTKPRPFLENMNTFDHRTPFPGGVNEMQFRSGLMPHVNPDQVNQGPMKNIANPAYSHLMSNILANSNPSLIPGATNLAGNASQTGLLGSGPGLLNFEDTDKSFQEHVKLFKQMLYHNEKFEGSNKKDKEKSKRHVVKYSRNSDIKDFGFDKSSRKQDKHDNSKKKKSRSKSKKPAYKERLHKGKGIKAKSDRKHRNKSPKYNEEKELDHWEDVDDGQGLSDFSDNLKSYHSSSDECDADFGVKSYEEILREKALRNLLEKKKLRQLTEDGISDENSRARIEEIERELSEVSRKKYKTGEEEKEDQKKVEEVDAGSSENKNDAKTEKEEGELENSDTEARRSPFQENLGSPASSEISLQAGDENLSDFNFDEEKEEEEEKKKKERKKLKYKIPQKETTVNTEENAGKHNKSLDLGIKSFEEIMKEKDERRQPENSLAQRQLKSIIRSQTKNSRKEADLKNVDTSVDLKGGEKKERKLIRKVTLGNQGSAEKKEATHVEAASDTKSTLNLNNATAASGSPKKTTLKRIPLNASRAVNSTTETQLTTLKGLNREEPRLKVKTFEEIMREKRERQKKRQTPEKEDKVNEQTNKVKLTNAQPGNQRSFKKSAVVEENTKTTTATSGVPAAATTSLPTVGTSAERTRRLLLKRPSTKQKAEVAFENTSVHRDNKLNGDQVDDNTAISTKTNTSKVPVFSFSASGTTVSSTSNATLNSARTCLASFSRSHASVLSPLADSTSASVTYVTSSCSESTDSFVARVSPFLYNASEKISTNETGTVSSTQIPLSSVDGTSSHSEANDVRRNAQSRRRSSESSKKRRSSDGAKTPQTDDGELSPSPTKRAKSVPPNSNSNKPADTTLGGDGIGEASDEEQKKQESELLSDEELEREIANLSPLSSEDYDDIDEDDLLMEVEAVIND